MRRVGVADRDHPVVTLLVPHLEAPSVEINLGKGTLLLSPDALGDGSRQINVGAGTVELRPEEQ